MKTKNNIKNQAVAKYQHEQYLKWYDNNLKTIDNAIIATTKEHGFGYAVNAMVVYMEHGDNTRVSNTNKEQEKLLMVEKRLCESFIRTELEVEEKDQNLAEVTRDYATKVIHSYSDNQETKVYFK